jgi:hypothetical protein
MPLEFVLVRPGDIVYAALLEVKFTVAPDSG